MIGLLLKVVNIFKGVIGAILSIVKILLWSRKNTLPRESGDVIVLGNGPSLKKVLDEDIDKLKQKICIAVNNFAFDSVFEKLKPKYYLLHPKLYFQPDEELSANSLKLKRELWDCMENKVNWEMFIMIPQFGKVGVEFKQAIIKNKCLIPIFYNTTPIEGLSWFEDLTFRLGLGMPRPHNVVIPGIMNAINMGFTKILLLGVDHDWLKDIGVTSDNLAVIDVHHFNREKDAGAILMQDWLRPRRLHEIIYKSYLTFKGYWILKRFAEKENISIINCTENSMIDAFERGTWK